MLRRFVDSVGSLMSVAIVSAGCVGDIVGSGGDRPEDEFGDMTPGPGGMSPGGTSAPGLPTGPLRAADLAPARARRLTATEIRNSVADIFFAGAVDRVPPFEGPILEGFSNDIEAANVGIAFMESLETFATATSAKVVADLARLTSCNVAAMGAPACAAAFVVSYGPLIYRRPLDVMESARLRDTFVAASRSGTYEQGLEAVTQMMLMAPHFVFRTELGAGKDASGIVTLLAHERAAALSYGFWQTTPDAQLTAAAASGALMTAPGLRAEVKRLASSARTRPTLRSFVREWLGIHPTTVAKADRTYTAAVARAAEDETGRFVDDVLGRSEGALGALWTSTRSYVNATLAKVYGVDVTSPTPVAVELPADQQRGGILSLAGFVASHTPSETFSPIHIALALRDRVLCFAFPPAPAGVPDPPVNPNWSVREKAARHRSDPACGSCHSLMDPLGFGFERLGVTGQYRTVEQPTKALLSGEGELTGTDVDGRFVGPAELGRKLAQSAEVRTCAAAQALSYLLGRPTGHSSERTPADQLALRDVLAPGTGGATGDVRALLADLAASETFVRRDGSRLP